MKCRGVARRRLARGMAPKTSEASVTAEEIAEQRAALRQLWRLYSDRVLPVEDLTLIM